MIVLFYLFLFLNLIAFILIGYDKYLSKKHKSRISENTLLTFAALKKEEMEKLKFALFRKTAMNNTFIKVFYINAAANNY